MPSPPRISTGCELEFAVIYVFKSPNAFDSGPPMKYIDDDLPQPFEIDNPCDDERDPDLIAEAAVKAAIQAILKSAGFPTDKIVCKANSTLAAQRLDSYRHWTIGTDSSLRVSGLSAYKNRYNRRLKFVPVEIASPVEWESPESFEVVRYAVNLLASRFRIEINPSMGLHVHVGDGPSYMAYKWIKRMGILFWAADRLLATLNPPTRRYNYYCPGIRELSNLSKDTPGTRGKLAHELNETERNVMLLVSKDDFCEPYLAKDVRLGEESPLWRERHIDPRTVQEFGETRKPGVFRPFISQDAPLTGAEDAAEPEDPRVTIERYDLSHCSIGSDEVSGRPDPKAINETTQSLPPRRSQPVIADSVASLMVLEGIVLPKPRLSSFPRVKLPKWSEKDIGRFDYLNYTYSDVQNYDNSELNEDRGVWYGVEQLANTNASCEVAGMLHATYRPNFNFREYECRSLSPMDNSVKRTIEWRQGAGSMDGAWISVWMRIVAGVSRFAVNAPTAQFLRVLRSCARAELGEAYDVLDFLEDIGLVAEAQVAGQRIWDLGEDWGLEYEEQIDGENGQTE